MAGTVDTIFAALRNNYRLTVKEARSWLNLTKNVRTSLPELASQIERPVKITYADLPNHHYQKSMALDTFLAILYQPAEAPAAHNDRNSSEPSSGRKVFLQVQVA